MSNRLSKMVKKINHAPKGMRPWLLTKLFCSQVKYANTTGIRILSIEANRVEIELANKTLSEASDMLDWDRFHKAGLDKKYREEKPEQNWK